MAPTQLEEFISMAPPLPEDYAAQLAPLTAGDVVGTYFVQGLAGIDPMLTRFEWTTDGDELGWNVMLFESSGVCVNAQTKDGQVLEIMRKLHVETALRGVADGRGRAGHNLLICLAPPFRRRGLGRFLDRRERALFSCWGAQELHLEAGCDALKEGTWLRLGYKPDYAEQISLEEEWRDFQRWELKRSGQDLDQFPRSWDAWPQRFRDIICNRDRPMRLYVELP